MRPVISSIGTHFRLDAVTKQMIQEGPHEDTRDQRQKATSRGSHVASSKGAVGPPAGRPDTAQAAWSLCLLRVLRGWSMARP